MSILLAALSGLLNKKVSSIASRNTAPVHILIYSAVKLIPFCQERHGLYLTFFRFVVEAAIYLARIKVRPRKTG
ncbi:MAG: hypothetical protein HFG01_11995 [Oscillibacter sp.]|nr:hypothetical protein [Oscillibacter sp.]